MAIDKLNNVNQTYTAPAKSGAREAVAQTAKPKATSKAGKSSAAAKMAESAKPDVVSDTPQEIAEDNKKIKNVISEVNKKMNQKTRCEFAYHEETKRVSIKIINVENDKVIKEIPPEETLEMISKMWEMAGILVDVQK